MMAPLPWRILVAATAAAALSTTSNYRTPLTTRAAASTSSTAPTEKPTNKLARAAKFWQRAVPIVGKYVTGPVTMQLRERVLGECLSDDECEVVWDDAHASGAAQARKVVDELGGFYVKTGQIIASRSDLFPRQYSDALAGLTDLVDPMDGAYVRGIVAAEVLRPGEGWDDVFESWDDAPLGAASVAQAHRATLTAKYGGKDVAVKVQRPRVEETLLGDVNELKKLSKPLRDVTPVDYYVVFTELESQLKDEFDFVAEAAAMDRVHATLNENGRPPPLVVPRPVAALCTKNVLVMDFLDGEPLSRVAARVEDFSKDPVLRASGVALLEALTEAFGKCIFGTGFFHADPHPGNLLLLADGRVGLIDFGQVKQISGKNRATLGKVMVALATRTKSDECPSGTPEELLQCADLGRELGVVLNPDAPPEGPAAVSMWLFDDAGETLPGGYEQNELSPNSPATALTSFPQDLVLVARSSVLIKGLAAKLGVTWSLASRWAPIASDALGLGYDAPRPGRAQRLRAAVKRRAARVVAPFVRRRIARLS